MAKLLHFEFHKLIRQKSFYICLAVAVAMLVVSTCTTYLINKDVMDTAEMGIDAMNVMIGSASGGVLSMVIGVFIPLFACEDYVSGTIRNIVTRGYSRLGIFSAKLIAVMLATAVMTIACMAAGYLIGLDILRLRRRAFRRKHGEDTSVPACRDAGRGCAVLCHKHRFAENRRLHRRVLSSSGWC